MKTTYTDILVIGAGPVGIYCSYLAVEKGLKSILIEATSSMGGQPINLYEHKEIHDYPLFANIKASEFTNKLISQFNSLNEENVLLNTQVIDFEKKDEGISCLLNNDETIIAKAIIISTGNGFFEFNKLDIPGANDHKDIQYKVDDITAYNNKSVVILGGGDSAVDFANLIATQTNAQTTIIHRRDQFRANGVNVEQLTKNHVNVVLNTLCDKVEDNVLFTHNSLTNEVKEVKFDKLIVQYGQKINLTQPTYYKKLDIQMNRIKVNQNMETNFENVYAIGNACIYPNRPNLIITGHGEAGIAVTNILNKIKKYAEEFKA